MDHVLSTRLLRGRPRNVVEQIGIVVGEDELVAHAEWGVRDVVGWWKEGRGARGTKEVSVGELTWDRNMRGGLDIEGVNR